MSVEAQASFRRFSHEQEAVRHVLPNANPRSAAGSIVSLRPIARRKLRGRQQLACPLHGPHHLLVSLLSVDLPHLLHPLLYSTIKVVIVLYVSSIVPRTSARPVAFPALVQRAGKNAIFAAGEFFAARLSNPHNRRPYGRPVENFLAWGEQQGIELRQVTPSLAGHFLPHYLRQGRGAEASE